MFVLWAAFPVHRVTLEGQQSCNIARVLPALCRETPRKLSSFYLAANTGAILGLSITNAVLQGTVRHGLSVSLRDQPQKDTVCSKYSYAARHPLMYWLGYRSLRRRCCPSTTFNPYQSRLRLLSLQPTPRVSNMRTASPPFYIFVQLRANSEIRTASNAAFSSLAFPASLLLLEQKL
jgi:hypothetical protein